MNSLNLEEKVLFFTDR